MTTCRGNHRLITIFDVGPEMERTVVRWCERCGAVTVDLDTDGRTSPGAVMEMMLPGTEVIRQGITEEPNGKQ